MPDEYVIVEKSTLDSIGDTVRSATGSTENISVNNLNDAVAAAITSGGVLIDSSLTQSGYAADAKATGDAIRSLSEEIDNLPSSGGMSANARNLLISILKSGLYEEDQTGNILALEAALAATGSGGTVETPVDGVTQTGNILSVVSGVTVSQTDAMLLIA